jgi:hypothetical protein
MSRTLIREDLLAGASGATDAAVSQHGEKVHQGFASRENGCGTPRELRYELTGLGRRLMLQQNHNPVILSEVFFRRFSGSRRSHLDMLFPRLQTRVPTRWTLATLVRVLVLIDARVIVVSR